MTISFRMLRSAIVGFLVFGVLIFGPAGTVGYWRGWAFILVFTICTNIMGLYLARTDPALLERISAADGPLATHLRYRVVQKEM